jgi:hypothetical protein
MSLVISLLPFNHSQSNLLHLFNIFFKTFYRNMNKGIPFPKLNIVKTKQVTDTTLTLHILSSLLFNTN